MSLPHRNLYHRSPTRNGSKEKHCKRDFTRLKRLHLLAISLPCEGCVTTKFKKPKQLKLLKAQSSAYGGVLLNTRSGRSRGRPIDTKNTTHLILRSTKAKGDWSFLKSHNKKKVKDISKKFATKYGIRIISLANVGNHLHFHLKIGNRYAYKAFIRALTGALVMAITGVSRWRPSSQTSQKFWDYRPYTRVVIGLKALLSLKDYISINRMEGFGYTRDQARFIIEWEKARSSA